jgi:hypothetical protein
MFLLRHSIDRCIAAFKHLADRAFFRPQYFKGFWINTLIWLFRSFLTDSLYGAVLMERCVKEAYGSESLLFGSLGTASTISGTKIAVTTMSVAQSRLCILSNYNGARRRTGYKHYRPQKVENEILICDA